MTVAFMGLTGPQGVLPRYYTELMLERLQAKDQTLRDFFDVFNHRMISLFFRAWEKHHCTVGFEQWLLLGKEDRFARCLFALAGLGNASCRRRGGGAAAPQGGSFVSSRLMAAMSPSLRAMPLFRSATRSRYFW